jgi:hypothetical protein
MEIEFTKKNKHNVAAALAGEKPYRKLSSAEWHQFVQNYNYDNGLEPFFWLIEQADVCDKGTALCLYWYLSPDYFCGRTLDEDDVNIENHKLLKEIEARYTRGFYQNERFSFDPSAEFLTAETNTGGIPEEMLRATGGVPFGELNVETAWLRHPNEKERKTIRQKIDNALASLRQLDSQFTDTDPDSTAEAVTKAIGYFKREKANKRKTRDLSCLWLDCVRRKHGWDWVIWDYETNADYGVSNPSRELTVLEDGIAAHSPKTIMQLFRDLDGAVDTRELADRRYFSSGLLFSTNHLTFREDAPRGQIAD